VGATVSAADPDGAIHRVEFLVGNKQVAVDRETRYEQTFTGLAAGTHTLKARAVDSGVNPALPKSPSQLRPASETGPFRGPVAKALTHQFSR
jgi:hypothetical protein